MAGLEKAGRSTRIWFGRVSRKNIPGLMSESAQTGRENSFHSCSVTQSLSGILCLRHSMSKRSIYANESKDRWGGHSGIAAHFV